MRKLLVAFVALTAAAAVVVLGLPASAAGPRSFTAHSKTVRAGQQIKVSGKGCGSQAFVRFYLNDIEIDNDRADRAGQFVDNVEIPTSMDLGEAELKAGCSGFPLGTVTITILGSRFDVEPRRVEAGELITVSGSLCKARSYVTIKLNGRLIGDGHATSRGQFRIKVRIPSDAEGSQEVSARCHGKFVGVKIIIIIVVIYPTQQSLVSADRTAVPAGQTVTLRGTDCPTGNPTASLDGQQLNLNVNRRTTGKGFTATATIPASVSSGKHSLWAGCDAGSAGTTQLQVLGGAEPAAARMEFVSQPPSSHDGLVLDPAGDDGDLGRPPNHVGLRQPGGRDGVDRADGEAGPRHLGDGGLADGQGDRKAAAADRDLDRPGPALDREGEAAGHALARGQLADLQRAGLRVGGIGGAEDTDHRNTRYDQRRDQQPKPPRAPGLIGHSTSPVASRRHGTSPSHDEVGSVDCGVGSPPKEWRRTPAPVRTADGTARNGRTGGQDYRGFEPRSTQAGPATWFLWLWASPSFN